MTEFVDNDLSFGDLILREEFVHHGKLWLSFLLVPQEHLEDLFHAPGTIKPRDAYEKAPEFWDKISELTRDSYRKYLDTQAIDLKGRLRRQWFQWKDCDRLEAAFKAFNPGANKPIRLSIVARDPVH
jgi:hypothetical protein